MIFIKEASETVRKMVLELCSGKVEKFMMENGKMIKWMVQQFFKIHKAKKKDLYSDKT